jgi:hypothetical protein
VAGCSVLLKESAKLTWRGLEPVGVDVGDVVADDIHVLLETVQSADGRRE